MVVVRESYGSFGFSFFLLLYNLYNYFFERGGGVINILDFAGLVLYNSKFYLRYCRNNI